MIEEQAIDGIERSIQHRLAIDSLAVAVGNSRNRKDVLPIRRTREPYKTQHQERTVRGAHAKCPSMVSSAISTPLIVGANLAGHAGIVNRVPGGHIIPQVIVSQATATGC
jgi:predicted DNA-binding helix-hairpin-helix protein